MSTETPTREELRDDGQASTLVLKEIYTMRAAAMTIDIEPVAMGDYTNPSVTGYTATIRSVYQGRDVIATGITKRKAVEAAFTHLEQLRKERRPDGQ